MSEQAFETVMQRFDTIPSPAAVQVAPLFEALPGPARLTPVHGRSFAAALPRLRAEVERSLTSAGGLLFRGFEWDESVDFRGLCASLGSPLLGYDFGSTPRTQLGDGVYSSTEYPPDQYIPLHNEQSYARAWPMKIWFHCQVAAQQGGETPIADSRLIFQRMPLSIRARFAERGLMYVRNFGSGLDVPWPRAFNTGDRTQVESFCRAQGIACEWRSGDRLRTRQVCQAVARHPRTRQDVWFNQAHLFHVSALEAEVRDALLEVLPPDELPRNVYYGDGSPIEGSLLEEVRAVLRSTQLAFSWQAGDVLLLDNMLMAHARNPFRGPRRVVVAMTELHSESA